MEGGRSGSGRIVRWVLFLLVVVGVAVAGPGASCFPAGGEAPLMAPGGGSLSPT
jgi:hypothetical protein